MGRPERHDADYFPFYVKEGKTLFILESKYGLKGIGFFTNLMRFLTRQTDHHICIKEESDRLYFFAQIRCPEDIGTDMLTLMAKTGKIDAELWGKSQVIVSEDLLASLKDAYKNRNNPIIEIDKIRLSYHGNEITYQGKAITYHDKPQTKLKETKLKETKIRRTKTPLNENFTISDAVKAWAKTKGHSRLQEHLESFKAKCLANGYEYVDWDSAFMEAVRSDWAKLSQPTGGNGNGRYTRGPGLQDNPPLPEYRGEDIPDISEPERQANLKRLRAITGGIGKNPIREG